MKERRMTKTNTAVDDIGYALYAFGGLGIEILLMMAETNLYGFSAGSWSTAEHIIHWTITCLVWGCLGIMLMKRLPAVPRKAVERGNLIAACLVAAGSVLYTSLVWRGLKPVIELSNLGVGKFLGQYIYYAFESLLILLIIIFGQSALESWFGHAKGIPFGGILLAVTWGLMHILTQGIRTGCYTFVQALLFGSIYLFLNKNVQFSYVAIVLIFMI